MYLPNYFMYFISCRILENTVIACPKSAPSHSICSNFICPHFSCAAYKPLEIDVWEKGQRVWDQETHITHILYRKYIGLETRLFSTSRYFKTYNVQYLDDVETNPWYTPKIRQGLAELYFKTYRVIGGFKRFARLWKIRRTQVQIGCDLYMTPLDPASKFTFRLFQNGKQYLFSLSDLTNIVVSSIMNCHLIPYSDRLEHLPKIIKNPYNNVPFKKSDLYNMYFQMERTFVRVNEHIRRFFSCDFNIYRFSRENAENIEREGALTLFKNASKQSLGQIAKTIFARYVSRGTTDSGVSRFHPTLIHKDFPIDTLIGKLRPHLELYFLLTYTRNGKERYGALLKHTFKNLMEYCPNFGQPIYSCFGNVSGAKKIVGFHDQTPNDKYKYSSYFMETHAYDDVLNNRYSYMGDTERTYDTGMEEIRSNMRDWTRMRTEQPLRRQRVDELPANRTHIEQQQEQEQTNENNEADEEDNDEDNIIEGSDTDTDSYVDEYDEFDDTFDD